MKNLSAFPVQSVYIEDQETNSRGMTLRDYFAAKALQGTIASGQIGNEEPCHEEYISIHAYARDAYRWADAMLKAREGT